MTKFMIHQTLPTVDSSFRDWTSTARKFGEVLARFHALDSVRAGRLRAAIVDLQTSADERLRQWTDKHYADLPSLPVAKGAGHGPPHPALPLHAARGR